MNKEERLDYSTICVAFALLVHVVVLCSLFFSFFPLTQKQDSLNKFSPTINPHPSTPTLSAPIVLYSGTVTQPTQAETPQFSKQLTSFPQESGTSTTQNTIPEEEKPTAPIAEPTKAPTLFEAAEKPFKQSKETDTGQVRRRQLTLADLFKGMPHMMKKIAEGVQDSQELVIVQGDMKHYSFLKKFVTHINQVFAFQGGPEKMLNWAQNGSIKQRAGISVTIDRKGNVLSSRLMRSCGHTQADELLLNAINAASPFPPVPAHIAQKTVRVELVSIV